uniref:Putative serine proteinase inhibitor n=1 Tax=Culex tarsalis TaxID=7177 RepID=A0A1Q3FSN9_CULTA
MRSNVIVLLCCVAVASCSEGSARFTVDFFKHAYNPRQNAILAPIAIQSGLAMMHHVATPDVARILRDGLYLPANGSEVIEQTKLVLRGINERRSSLEILSRVYLPDRPLNPELVPHLRDNFGIGSEIVNFAEHHKVADRVNTWVNESSRGMIPEFLKADELSDGVTSLLINVMVMNASWGFFDEKKTKKQTFHFLNGDHVVDMMKVEGTLPRMVLADLMTDAIKLPYAHGSDLSMVILLPRMEVNLEHVIKRFTADHYKQLVQLDSEDDWFGNIHLGVPRFKIEQKLDAKETLQRMGLGALFDQEAFQVLAKRLSKLGQVKQSAFISVNERGTEAAAAAAIQSFRISGPRNIDIDRPFMYIIRKESTKDIVFIGHYSNYEG